MVSVSAYSCFDHQCWDNMSKWANFVMLSCLSPPRQSVSLPVCLPVVDNYLRRSQKHMACRIPKPIHRTCELGPDFPAETSENTSNKNKTMRNFHRNCEALKRTKASDSLSHHRIQENISMILEFEDSYKKCEKRFCSGEKERVTS